MIHRLPLLSLAAALLLCCSATAATVENEYFSFTPPDDSWRVESDAAQHSYSARVFVSRYDSKGATLELARIDFIAGAFDPAMYLDKQVRGKQDVFCRSASNVGAVTDTVFGAFAAKGVAFAKQSNNLDYDCHATAFNAGFGTYLIVTAHRHKQPTVIGRVLRGLAIKECDTTLTTAKQMAKAAAAVTAKHRLPIANNEWLSGVEIAPDDSTTMTLRVVVPYITKEAVRVPAFVMSKREAWFKQAHEMLRFNKLLEAATREKMTLRYFYVDTKGKEIGTLLIMPEEYEPVLKQIEDELHPPEAANGN